MKEEKKMRKTTPKKRDRQAKDKMLVPWYH